MRLSILRLYSIDDRLINKYGTIGGMRTGMENQRTWKKFA
jgi:hypothetical protein